MWWFAFTNGASVTILAMSPYTHVGAFSGVELLNCMVYSLFT